MIDREALRASGIARSALLAALAFAGAAGCGDDGKIPLHPASGRVIADGEPARGVRVRLHPADRLEDIDAPRPFATTGEDGVFHLGTFEGADGAPAGRYKVTFFWPDPPEGSDRPDDLLGGQYSAPEKTALEASISPKENQLGPYEVKKSAAKPATGRRASRAARPDNDGLGEPAPR